MIKPDNFYDILTNLGMNYFTGVPDSLLKGICACITDRSEEKNHVIAANEGGAMGLAIGYHLSTGNVPLVYMQNSGLGNIINPLLSMADDRVYAIPMILLIGWRGEILEDGSQIQDEPQHKKQGQVTEALLSAMGIKYVIINKDSQDMEQVLSSLLDETKSTGRPVALLVRKGTFDGYTLQKGEVTAEQMSREEAIEAITDNIAPEAFVVSTTGMPSRELFEQRVIREESHDTDFLVVGGMGHASQIACEISKRYTGDVYCLDGDGSFLMHMGGIAINARGAFCHIVLNNAAHDSVGGQPTVANQIDIPAIARSCGYRYAVQVTTRQELKIALIEAKAHQSHGVCLIEVKVKKGARSDLGRPTLTSLEMKDKCMSFLQK